MVGALLGDQSAGGMGLRNKCGIPEGMKPAAGMVVVQVVFGGVNILYKLALNDGMDFRVLVAYRYLFAFASLAPIAFFMERTRRPKLTWKIMGESFLCGLFGGTLAQNLYMASMKMTSATFASAMTNLIPSITFILAVLFGLEKLAILKSHGQAKVLGTVLGLGGAMLLTLYRGPVINLWSKTFDLMKPHSNGAATTSHQEGNQALGSLLAVASCLSYSTWLIIQAKMSKMYPCPYSNTTLMCMMGSIQAIFLALLLDRDWSQWRLGFNVRLLTVAYSGILASGLVFTVMAWCIERKGPLYASVFSPLMVVIVAFLGSLLLDEKLRLGNILGAVLIIIGLYIVLWGKGREVAWSRELHSESMRSMGGPVDVLMVPGTIAADIVSLEDNEEVEHNAAKV